MSDLDDLGRQYGTDKASGSHDYLRVYDIFLTPLRDQSIIVFEMGVGDGASLKMWRDYFPNAFVFGMDINQDKHSIGDGKRMSVWIGDQSKAEDLDRACPFPIGVACDDAGHQPDHQLFAYKHLIPKVMPGGIYILEDIGDQNLAAFLGRLAGHCIRASWNEDPDDWVKTNGPRIELVCTYRETSITRIKA